MNKLLLIITVFFISSCSENSFDSCVSEVEKFMYESWEKNHIRSIKVPSYDEKKFSLDHGDGFVCFSISYASFKSE